MGSPQPSASLLRAVSWAFLPVAALGLGLVNAAHEVSCLIEQDPDAQCTRLPDYQADASAGVALLQLQNPHLQAKQHPYPGTSASSPLSLQDAWKDASLRDFSRTSLAIVGNGPLTEDNRVAIRLFPAEDIIRFNAMPNLRFNEPVGRVYANAYRNGGWWGVTAAVCSRIADAVEVVLFGKPDDAFTRRSELIDKWGDKFTLGIADGCHLEVDGRNLKATGAWKHNGGFSVGFKGIAYARWRYPNAKLHIFGFTWANDDFHPFAMEHAGVLQMKNVVVHGAGDESIWHGAPFEGAEYECQESNVQAKLLQGSAPNSTDLWSLWAGEPQM